MQQHVQGWTVGAQVFVVTGDRPGNTRTQYLPITKIGRKWITVGVGWQAYRFDAETCRLDGRDYLSPGRVWPHEDDYRDSLAANQAWTAFIHRLPHQPPDHMNADAIAAISRAIWPTDEAPTADSLGG